MEMKKTILEKDSFFSEIEDLRLRLSEAEEALNAIRNGEVDAIVVSGDEGEKIFSLTSSDTPYRIILEEMDEGAITMKLDGTILYSNQRFANLLSEPLGNILCSNIRKYISPGAKRKFLRLLKKTGNGRANGVISFKPNDNSPLYLKLSLRQLPHGISGDICIIASDVTSLEEGQQQLRKIVRKRNIELEEANEKLRKDLIDIKNTEADLEFTLQRFYHILSGMNNGILLVTEEDKIEFANKAFCNVFKLKEFPEELLNLPSEDLFIKIQGCFSDPEKAHTRITEIIKKGVPDTGEEIPMYDGRTYSRDFTPIKSGEKLNGWLWNYMDITHRIQSEKRLKELIATKDKFFNIVAHDLKNPFTSLIGSSELLSKNLAQMNPEKISALASIFNDAAKNGYAILENLLDWSRSQTGLLKYDPGQLNLRNLIEEHIMSITHSVNNKEIEILSKIKDDTYIYADQYMIKTVIRNLLSNAVKFSFRKGIVVIDAVENNGEVIISIKDNGRGIAQNDIEKIFRIDSKFSLPGTENELGTGLGLKLCKEFVENQGGNIWVESVEKKGSEFKFSIPAHSSGSAYDTIRKSS